MIRAGIIAAALLGSGTSRADGMELEASLHPSFAFVQRHGGTIRGAGGGLRIAHGTLPYVDFMAFEGGFSCERFNNVRHEGVQLERRTGAVEYDATRCTVGPSVAARYGGQLVATGALGLAYRYESRSDRQFGSVNDNLISRLDMARLHQVVASLRGSVEYRALDLFAVGAQATAHQAFGEPLGLDVTVGLALSVFLYP